MLDESLLKRICEYLRGMIETNGNDEIDWMKRMKASLCLRGLCEKEGLTSFILFFSFYL
jgi:hypothetical protein